MMMGSGLRLLSRLFVQVVLFMKHKQLTMKHELHSVMRALSTQLQFQAKY